MQVGDKFYSYQEFVNKLKEYEARAGVDFWMRDCLTLETQARRFPNGPAAQANPNLKYSHLRLSCVLGGRDHVVKGTRSSKKQGCLASIIVCLNKTGKYLEVAYINKAHNHVHLQPLLNMPEAEITNKYQLTIKDFSRINTNEVLKDEFYECVSLLKVKYNCCVSILCYTDDNVFCLLFQSNEMKFDFEAFPDVLFIEKVNNDNDTVVTYLFMVEDSEGNGIVVGVAIMLQINVINELMNAFCEANPCVEKIKIIMAERECTLAKAFSNKYPHIKVQIPFFHSINYIKEEVSPQLLKTSSKKCGEIIKSWKALLFCSSQKKYNELLNDFKKIAPTTIYNKFQKVWQPIEEQWTLFRTLNYRFMSNNSKYRIEIVRHTYKSVAAKFSKFKDFIEMFFSSINSIKKELNLQSQEYKRKSDTTDELYKEYLTKYAYEKVQIELTQSKDCYNFQIVGLERAFAPTPEGTLQVESNSCDCLFRITMQLPCRHILKFRSIIYLPLFDESLCDEKWSQGYCRETVAEEPLMDKQNKIEEMKDVADAIAKVCVDVPMNVYSKRLSYIKGLKRKWIQEKEEN